jgi:hypothetical protein
MVCYYTIVQYYPDPIADERINIGLMVFGHDQVRSRFLRDWHRVVQFGKEDISFLHDFVQRAETWDEATLKDCIIRWDRSIQFRQPLPSSLEPEDLLDEMARLFLREPRVSVSQSDAELVAAS